MRGHVSDGWRLGGVALRFVLGHRALQRFVLAAAGVVAVAAAGVAVVAVVLRTTPTTQARGDDARTLQGLVTWLPQDVDSTPAGSFDTAPGAVSGCSVSPGMNLLRLQWNERAGSQTVTYIANYRHVLVGDAYRIPRITCSGVGAQPFTTGFAQNMTSELPAPPSGCAGSPPAAPAPAA